MHLALCGQQISHLISAGFGQAFDGVQAFQSVLNGLVLPGDQRTLQTYLTVLAPADRRHDDDQHAHA